MDNNLRVLHKSASCHTKAEFKYCFVIPFSYSLMQNIVRSNKSRFLLSVFSFFFPLFSCSILSYFIFPVSEFFEPFTVSSKTAFVLNWPYQNVGVCKSASPLACTDLGKTKSLALHSSHYALYALRKLQPRFQGVSSPCLFEKGARAWEQHMD